MQETEGSASGVGLCQLSGPVCDASALPSSSQPGAAYVTGFEPCLPQHLACCSSDSSDLWGAGLIGPVSDSNEPSGLLETFALAAALKTNFLGATGALQLVIMRLLSASTAIISTRCCESLCGQPSSSTSRSTCTAPVPSGQTMAFACCETAVWVSVSQVRCRSCGERLTERQGMEGQSQGSVVSCCP